MCLLKAPIGIPHLLQLQSQKVAWLYERNLVYTWSVRLRLRVQDETCRVIAPNLCVFVWETCLVSMMEHRDTLICSVKTYHTLHLSWTPKQARVSCSFVFATLALITWSGNEVLYIFVHSSADCVQGSWYFWVLILMLHLLFQIPYLANSCHWKG